MAFKLQGDVEGAPVCFLLGAGEHRVGSSHACAFRLEHPAVSRQHALLRVTDHHLEVEDLDAKNGLFVNGNRVSAASARHGDTVAFGPVCLEVVAVASDDADLAISTVVGGDGLSSTASLSTITGATPTPPDRPAVDLVNQLGRLLLGSAEPEVTAALGLLAGALSARGAAVYEWPECGAPRCLHLAGDPAGLPDGDRLHTGAAIGWGGMQVVDGAEPPFTAVLSDPLAPPRTALIVLGDGVERSVALPLLEHTLRLVTCRRRHQSAVPAARPRQPRELVLPPGHVRGTSAAMIELYAELRSLVDGDLPVLITGETGVGKEHVARILHLSSARDSGPFVAVNCAAIPAELLEAELFGIEKGVATGVTARTGKVQLAEGGVLFLDEVGDMPDGLQAKLLRVLQEMEVSPLGAKAPLKVDVRVVAATNHVPQSLLTERRFRQDLYYRLAGYTLRVPPLRERREDLPALVESFVHACSLEVGKRVAGVTVKALRALATAPWPGNVRELQHEVRRLVYRCPDGAAVDSSMLSPALTATDPGAPLPPAPEGAVDLKGEVAALERRLVSQVLAQEGGNKSAAARRLGLTRNGLTLKLARLGIGE